MSILFACWTFCYSQIIVAYLVYIYTFTSSSIYRFAMLGIILWQSSVTTSNNQQLQEIASIIIQLLLGVICEKQSIG